MKKLCLTFVGVVVAGVLSSSLVSPKSKGINSKRINR